MLLRVSKTDQECIRCCVCHVTLKQGLACATNLHVQMCVWSQPFGGTRSLGDLHAYRRHAFPWQTLQERIYIQRETVLQTCSCDTSDILSSAVLCRLVRLWIHAEQSSVEILQHCTQLRSCRAHSAMVDNDERRLHEIATRRTAHDQLQQFQTAKGSKCDGLIWP